MFRTLSSDREILVIRNAFMRSIPNLTGLVRVELIADQIGRIITDLAGLVTTNAGVVLRVIIEHHQHLQSHDFIQGPWLFAATGVWKMTKNAGDPVGACIVEAAAGRSPLHTLSALIVPPDPLPVLAAAHVCQPFRIAYVPLHRVIELL